MNYRIIFFICLLVSECSAAQSSPTIREAVTLPTSTFEVTSTPSPTEAVTLTSTQAATTMSAPAALPQGRQIIFEQSSNKQFAGTLYGEGDTAIILANMSIGSVAQWDPFIAAVDPQKFTTLTFDYRNINDPNPDVRLILDRLRQEGFQRVICIGASMGTRVCSSIAREPELVGMALIAGAVHHASVAETSYPKLFVSGALDVWAFDIENGFEKASEPKTLKLYENNRAHGTDLFNSPDRDAFLSLLLEFVNDLASG